MLWEVVGAPAATSGGHGGERARTGQGTHAQGGPQGGEGHGLWPPPPRVLLRANGARVASCAHLAALARQQRRARRPLVLEFLGGWVSVADGAEAGAGFAEALGVPACAVD